MRFKPCVGFLSIVVLATALFAQNARIDGMGGVGIIEDINRVIAKPADINKYPDQIQATATGAATFGSVIAIKSIGDMMNIGLIGNGGAVMQSNFYADAQTQLGSVTGGGAPGGGTPVLPAAFPPIPHLLFGMDMDALSLGVDFFVEYVRARNNGEGTVAGADYENTNKARISNVGGVVNLNLDLGDFSLSPLIGFSLPRISGLSENDASGTVTKVEEESEKGLYVKGGTEAGLTFVDLDWVAGIFYTYETYQFLGTPIAGASTKTPQFPAITNIINSYIGFSTELAGDLLFAAQYGLVLNFAKTKTELTLAGSTTETNTTTLTRAHGLACGFEKSVMKVWIFDELTARAGVNVGITDAVTKTKTETTGATTADSDARTNQANVVTTVNPTVGLALARGNFKFDLVTRIGNWVGTVSGPPVAKGTVTFDFGSGSSRSSSISSTPESSFEPAPTYETETETETAPPSDDYGF